MSQVLKDLSQREAADIYVGKSERLPVISDEQQIILSQNEQIQALQQDIERLESEVKQARIDGEEAGKEQAQIDLTAIHLKSAETLGSALQKAEVEFHEKLELLDVLSLQIAEKALAQIFGERSRYSTLLKDVVTESISTIDEKIITAIRISEEDFANLSKNFDELSLKNTRLEPDFSLSEGECKIDLIAGHIEISLERYWEDLRTILNAQGKAYGKLEPKLPLDSSPPESSPLDSSPLSSPEKLDVEQVPMTNLAGVFNEAP